MIGLQRDGTEVEAPWDRLVGGSFKEIKLTKREMADISESTPKGIDCFVRQVADGNFIYTTKEDYDRVTVFHAEWR